jgi:hypothetical protein
MPMARRTSDCGSGGLRPSKSIVSHNHATIFGESRTHTSLKVHVALDMGPKLRLEASNSESSVPWLCAIQIFHCPVKRLLVSRQ